MKHKLWMAAALSLGMASAFAQTGAVDVTDAWARGTVPGQSATGVFMTLQAHGPTTLVGVSTPAAANAEVHEMKLEGTLMKMRALPHGLPLPANEPVQLKPGGYHIMLTDLRAPLKKGDSVALTLRFESADHKKTEQQVQVPVRDLTAGAPGGGMAGMAHGTHGSK
ncbi:copper chaperone PCu(A)C [Pandoraea nosoerga]|uniref:Membrane protein n=1 Tax=Pandoraea nosoerga TaxID=2508296 RepID=A0A5E4S5S8_9BURK|nr:copper chaperone PCu(A)C [Pandoraea nosoerga]MBN4667317.1 copper chaperone PCu(A)C [Pandoraea nosoerga]MBN4676554.1 copper chaperone PCu(A)C [Pandoraea nosoerga]MBN4682116.1 copper chaperone PCu(A)C [Pandoraea nosoerga]MBN4743515.1 copper chaperone PCu(A)C [Pandoraea nosoerga]VVD70655.1 membrane protein [Pandoraea nosoerga]